MNDTSERILAILRSGDQEERIALFREMPPCSMKDSVTAFFQSERPDEQVIALSVLLTSYGFGQAAAFAGDLAPAAFDFALDVYKRLTASGGLMLSTVSAIASSGVRALNLVGRHAEAVELADTAIPDLEALGDDVNVAEIYAGKIEALIALHEIDDASQIIEQAERRPKQSGDLSRLKNLVAKATASATELPSVAAGPSTGGAASMPLETYRHLAALLGLGAEYMTKAGTEMNEWAANARLASIGTVFVDPATGHDPTRLAQALDDLGPIGGWARTHGHTEVLEQALWMLYMCHSRLGAPSKAADALQERRRSVEKTRAGIQDPLRRAGAGAAYPFLYPALCQMLRKAGRIEELLGAIEAAKGRAVADVMAQRAHQVLDEAVLAAPAARLRELTQHHAAHYLSFLVDDDDTLAVLVLKDGSLVAPDPIPLGKQQLRSLARAVDPRSWGEPELADPTGPRVAGIDEALAPLVAWLAPLFERGAIRDGDHLCYSPDEHLHQVPLAYVRLLGEPLVRRVSLSRTHGAHALSLILDRPVARPQAFAAFEVPGRQDIDNRAMIDQLHAAGAWLAQHLAGTCYRGKQATVETIRHAELGGRVLHFATHGTFPLEDARPAKNPFEHSGLALAGAAGLPDKDRIAGGTWSDELLTPERALAARLDLTASHVTLQACVTGLAREGIGGDALGLDWALFQLGASSLLASHWEVTAELSSEFALGFYRRWLEQGSSRAVAWRQTILDMIAHGGELASPYAWAAFSLSGDWR